MRRFPRGLACHQDGAAVLEFAVLGPTFILMLLGVFEFAIVMFVGSVLNSAVLDASRYGVTGSTVPGISREQRILDIVSNRTFGLIDLNDVEISTLVYQSLEDIGVPEPFTDLDGNGSYTPGEPFTDVNGSGQWEADMGAAGLGGPGDLVVYRLEYAWGLLTPLLRPVIGVVHHRASMVARNEPF